MQLQGCWQNLPEALIFHQFWFLSMGSGSGSESSSEFLFFHSEPYMIRPEQNRWTLSFSDQGLLGVPPSRIRTTGDAAFQLVFPKLWTEDVRNVDILSV